MVSATSTGLRDDALARAAAFGLLARLLGPDPTAWDSTELDALRDALSRLGAADALHAIAGVGRPDGARVVSEHSRLFGQARVSPYESGHVPTGPAGHTGRLADAAGFYAAFGFRSEGERPDHGAVELEFASTLALATAQAVARGDADAEAVSVAAWRAFLRDHLGGWLDALAERIELLDPSALRTHVVRCAARLVDGEVARLGVEVPDHLATAPGFDDDGPLDCAECPADC